MTSRHRARYNAGMRARLLAMATGVVLGLAGCSAENTSAPGLDVDRVLGHVRHLAENFGEHFVIGPLFRSGHRHQLHGSMRCKGHTIAACGSTCALARNISRAHVDNGPGTCLFSPHARRTMASRGPSAVVAK